MIREVIKKDILELDNLQFLFNKEIQPNSPLNKLKKTKYVKPKKIEDSGIFNYLKENHKIFLIEENKKIIGFVSGRILNQKGKQIEKYGKLDDLYVIYGARGKGNSSKLVEAMLNWFKLKKCKHVVLFAAPGKDIQKYYSKIGFDTIYYYMMKKL